jgi:hypothetical protein
MDEKYRLHPRIELVVVMIIIPMIVNALQFWVTDSYLQHNRASPEWLPSTPSMSSLSARKRGGNGHGGSNGDYATYSSSTPSNVRKSSRAVGPAMGHQSLSTITTHSPRRGNGITGAGSAGSHNGSNGIIHESSSSSPLLRHNNTNTNNPNGIHALEEPVDHGSLTDDASLVFSRDSDISMALPAGVTVPLISPQYHTRQLSIGGTSDGNFSDTGNLST